MTTLLLDTHALIWFAVAPHELSRAATDAIVDADELAIASVSWWELAWLAYHDRVIVPMPLRSWMNELAGGIRTVPTTPSIAETAVLLPDPFPRDPTDRLIYATAIEEGLQLVTKDERMRSHPHPRQITIW